MAIDLTVHLTDKEQAKILEIAALVAPGSTPLQVKQWAEKQAKAGLREAVARELNDYNHNSMMTAWPADNQLPPEQA